MISNTFRFESRPWSQNSTLYVVASVVYPVTTAQDMGRVILVTDTAPRTERHFNKTTRQVLVPWRPLPKSGAKRSKTKQCIFTYPKTNEANACIRQLEPVIGPANNGDESLSVCSTYRPHLYREPPKLGYGCRPWQQSTWQLFEHMHSNS